MMTDKNHNFKVHNFFSKQKALEDKAAFQKKAQDQYEQLNQELQDQREAENNTVAWNRRIKESSWLLNVDVVNLDDTGKDVDPGKDDDDQSSFALANELLKDKEEEKKGWGRLFGKPKKEERYKSEDEIRKEKIGRMLLQAAEKREREAFLEENGANILRLERSEEVLSRPRLPRHHHSIHSLPGYKKTEDPFVEKYRERNLSYYARPKFVSKIDSPAHFKSHAETLEEDRQARLFRVPGRYHNYMGSDRLHVLLHKPSTANALYPPNTPLVVMYIPEKELLPDMEEIARIEQKKAEERRVLMQKVTTVRPGKMSFARELVETQRPATEHSHSRRHNRTGAPRPRTYVVVEDDVSSIGDEVAYGLGDEQQVPSRHKSAGAGMDGSLSLDTYAGSTVLQSQDAIRPGFRQENSIRPEVAARIDMQRHRGARGLDRFGVKNLQLVSLRTKDRHKRAQSMNDLAMDAGVSVGAGGVGGDGGFRGNSWAKIRGGRGSDSQSELTL